MAAHENGPAAVNKEGLRDTATRKIKARPPPARRNGANSANDRGHGQSSWLTGPDRAATTCRRSPEISDDGRAGLGRESQAQHATNVAVGRSAKRPPSCFSFKAPLRHRWDAQPTREELRRQNRKSSRAETERQLQDADLRLGRGYTRRARTHCQRMFVRAAPASDGAASTPTVQT